MRLDMTITLGNVIQIALILGALFLGYAAIRDRLTAIETKLEPLWKEFERRRNFR